MSGPYADVVGPGSVEATRMAAADCMKAECKGMNVQVIYADHHNKPDVGLAIARKWIDQGSVNAMVDLTNSDRQSGVKGKSVSVRVDLGGGRIIQKKKNNN